MSQLLSTRIVVLGAILAATLPVAYRILSSPFLIFLLSPFLIVILLLSVLLLSAFLHHRLDYQPLPRSDLKRATRPLAFSTPAAWEAVLIRTQWSQNTLQSFPPLLPDSAQASAAINDIIALAVRDFVTVWYKEISSSPSFPSAVSSILHASLKQFLDRASTTDISSLVVKRILPKVTAHIDQFRESEIALRGASLERKLTQSEELDLLLASRYAAKGSGKLHPAVENLSTTFTKQTEELHLRNLVEKALPYILPETESRSRALTIVVREILVCAVIQPLVDMLSDPDFWNQATDRVAGAAIHQQKLITKVRNVLDAQSRRATRPSSTIDPPEAITMRTNVRQFESFLRSINQCASLLDARRLKNDVVGEIRRTRMLLASHEKDEWINGQKTEDVVAFLDRLYTAKRKVEERITILGGGEDARQSTYKESNLRSGLSLRDILRNPSSLSYFMEFMDRRHRSLLVQFWLTVESFKNPLESVDSASDEEEDEILQDSSSSPTIKEDISMIHNLYFSRPTPHPTLACIPQKHVDLIRSFVQNDSDTSPLIQRRVRHSVLLAQRQVEREMEQDFDDFESSDLWFRAISDTDFGNANDSTRAPLASEDKIRAGDTHATAYVSTYNQEASSHHYQVPEMRRAPSSTSSSQGGVSTNISVSSGRMPVSNIEVLMSPISDASSDSSRAPLFNDPEDQMQREEEQRMEAIKAALSDIMALEHDQHTTTSIDGTQRNDSVRRSRRHNLFSDVDEADNIAGSEIDDYPSDDVHDTTEQRQVPSPGDLQLSYEIARLGEKIAKLQAQSAILENLIKKAELTGDHQELRLLTRSKASLHRELRQLSFQKSQYEQQELSNRLTPDRTKVSIPNSTVGDEGGKSVVRYLVEIQLLASDGSFASGWIVARRYNEFLNMHNKLRDRFPQVRSLDFPGKRLVTSLSGSFLDNRRSGLEKYLQNLISIPSLCDSDELRAFLSRESPFVAASNTSLSAKGAAFSGTELVRTVYRSVTESIDDMFFGPSMLDVMIQRLTRQAAEFVGVVGSGVNDEDLVAQALKASGRSEPEAALMQLPGDLKPLDGETGTSSFTSPICDLVLALFELNKKDNWLRRQAIVIILQQILGGTIERRFRDYVKVYTDEAHLLQYLKALRDSLWLEGRLKTPPLPRSPDEKLRTRDEANHKLSSLFPDLAANMIGRSNARRGARRIFAVLQNRRLNQHIIYNIIDEVFLVLFPELGVS